MRDPIELRRAQPADLPAIEACVEAAYGMYFERMDTPPAPMLDDYSDLLSQDAIHVAAGDDGLLGVIVMWAEADHYFIDNVAVTPAAQGRGIAGRLLERAGEEAALAGHAELRLYTNEAMTENLVYYPKQGFEETHRSSESGYHRVYFARPVDALR